MAAAIAAAPVPVYAMEDGAYTVGRTTSYAKSGDGTDCRWRDEHCAWRQYV